MVIREVDFRKIDLNLLVVFHALMQEQSVARAAERLFLSPSAVSMALRRLRDLFGDTLFVRSGQRMVPTSRAEDIGPRIIQLLEAAHRLVYDQGAFNPTRIDRVFRIGASESCEVGLVAQLLCELRREAPQARLVVRPCDSASASRMIDDGEIDLALGYFRQVPPHHHCEQMCHHRFVCLYAPGTASCPISLDDYLQADHVLMSQAGDLEGTVDEHLRELGLQRRVVASTGRFSSLPSWLERSALVATVPAHVADAMARASALQQSELPFELSGYDVQMSWHKRLTDDDMQGWLRQLVRRVAFDTYGDKEAQVAAV